MTLPLRTSCVTVNSEPAVVVAPYSEWGRPSNAMPILYVGGYSTLPYDTVMSNTGKAISILARMGYPVMSINAGGISTFGNDVAIASITAQLSAFRSSTEWGGPRTKKVLLVGNSMGFCDALAWARTHSSEVAGAISLEGLTDLTEQWSANREIISGSSLFAQAEINNAYGGAYSDATYAPTHSPINFMGSMPFPILGFYATNDPLITLATVAAADALANTTYYSVGALGHSGPATLAAAQTSQFAAFVESCAASA